MKRMIFLPFYTSECNTNCFVVVDQEENDQEEKRFSEKSIPFKSKSTCHTLNKSSLPWWSTSVQTITTKNLLFWFIIRNLWCVNQEVLNVNENLIDNAYLIQLIFYIVIDYIEHKIYQTIKKKATYYILFMIPL